MRKSFAAISAAIFSIILFAAPAFAVIEYPTQTKHQLKENPVVTPSRTVIDDLFLSRSVADGIETITLTEDGKRLSSAMGTLSVPLTGDLQEAVESFITENGKLFNLPPETRSADLLSLETRHSSGTAEHFLYRMKIDNIPVRNATIGINLDKNNAVQLIHGPLPNVKQITNQVVSSKSQAIKAARKAAKIRRLRSHPIVQIEILPFDENEGLAKYVYNVTIPAKEPLGDWEVLLDAENDEVLSVKNKMIFAEPVKPNGKGAVYRTNPLKCRVTVEPLYDLTSSKLEGKYCTVYNCIDESASNPKKIHIYDPETTHFDEVSAYKHISTACRFFRSMGHTQMKPIDIYVRYEEYDIAFYSPPHHAICFGDSYRLNNILHEAAVSYHELAHANLYSIMVLNYEGESGAIDEGQADYFACSMTEDPVICEWFCAKMPNHIRNLENHLTYPRGMCGDVHFDGRIWGGTLWDIRKAIGKKDADFLIYKSLFYLKPDATFMDGFNALIASDKNNFKGKYAKTLTAIFANRGITPEAYRGAVISKRQIRELKNFQDAHGL